MRPWQKRKQKEARNIQNTAIKNSKFLRVLKKQKQQRGKRQKKQAPKRDVQSMLRYEKMFESGICELSTNYYSKSIQFSDINYQIASKEEQQGIFTKYCALLNSCEETMHLNVTLVKKKIRKEKLKKELFYKKIGNAHDEYREELNDLLSKKIHGGENNFIKENYLTFTMPAKELDQAKQLLARAEQTLSDSLTEIGSKCQKMDGLSRLRLIHKLLHSTASFDFNYSDLIYNGLSTKASIAPMSLNVKKKNYFEIEESYGQILYLKDYPANLTDKVISGLLEIPEEMTLSIHIDPIASDQANHLIQRKQAYMEGDKVASQRKALQKGYDPYSSVPYELTTSIDEAKLLLDDLRKAGQNLFFVSIFVYFKTDKKELLADIAKQVLRIGRKYGCGFNHLDYLQMEGLNSVLPFGKNWVMTQRTLTTTSTAIFLPFTAQDLSHETN